MKKALFTTSLLLILILNSTNVFAVQLIKAGPHGEPVLVMDAAGNFSIAIKVYSDSERDIYIPNLTASGWIQWNKEAFIKLGVYQTVVYEHFKKESFCLRELRQSAELCALLHYKRQSIFVDTRNNTIKFTEMVLIEKDMMWKPGNVVSVNKTCSLADNRTCVSKPYQMAIDRITTLIKNEVKKQ